MLLPPVALLLHLLRQPPLQWQQQQQQQLMEGQHILRRCSSCTPARALLPLSRHSCGMQQQEQRLLLVMLHWTQPLLMCCLPSHQQHWQQQQVQVQAVLWGRHLLQRQPKRHPWQGKQQQQQQEQEQTNGAMLKWKAVALGPKSMAVQDPVELQHLMPLTRSPCRQQQLQPHPAQQQQQQQHKVVVVLLLRLLVLLRPQLLHQLTLIWTLQRPLVLLLLLLVLVLVLNCRVQQQQQQQ